MRSIEPLKRPLCRRARQPVISKLVSISLQDLNEGFDFSPQFTIALARDHAHAAARLGRSVARAMIGEKMWRERWRTSRNRAHRSGQVVGFVVIVGEHVLYQASP